MSQRENFATGICSKDIWKVTISFDECFSILQYFDDGVKSSYPERFGHRSEIVLTDAYNSYGQGIEALEMTGTPKHFS
jgi:hypothetical protein